MFSVTENHPVSVKLYVCNNLFGKASPEIPDNTGSEVEIFKGSFYHHYK